MLYFFGKKLLSELIFMLKKGKDKKDFLLESISNFSYNFQVIFYLKKLILTESIYFASDLNKLKSCTILLYIFKLYNSSL